MSMLHIAIYEGRVGGRGCGLEVESASYRGRAPIPSTSGLTGPMLPYFFPSLSFLSSSVLFSRGSCGYLCVYRTSVVVGGGS